MSFFYVTMFIAPAYDTGIGNTQDHTTMQEILTTLLVLGEVALYIYQLIALCSY